jgi:hypothetical protein
VVANKIIQIYVQSKKISVTSWHKLECNLQVQKTDSNLSDGEEFPSWRLGREQERKEKIA